MDKTDKTLAGVIIMLAMAAVLAAGLAFKLNQSSLEAKIENLPAAERLKSTPEKILGRMPAVNFEAGEKAEIRGEETGIVIYAYRSEKEVEDKLKTGQDDDSGKWLAGLIRKIIAWGLRVR